MRKEETHPADSRATSSSWMSFPMIVTGKVQKFIMGRMVEQQLGLKRTETA